MLGCHFTKYLFDNTGAGIAWPKCMANVSYKYSFNYLSSRRYKFGLLKNMAFSRVGSQTKHAAKNLLVLLVAHE